MSKMKDLLIDECYNIENKSGKIFKFDELLEIYDNDYELFKSLSDIANDTSYTTDERLYNFRDYIL